MGRPMLDLCGMRFGKLVVQRLHHRDGSAVWWECLCDCGRLKVVRGSNLRQGTVQSCGCLLRDAHTTHGDSRTRLHNIWLDMKGRCTNPNHPRYCSYGGRGITICPEWSNSFATFREWAMDNGYRDDLSVDRIDNNSGYCPENCRFTDSIQQANNKGNNYHITYNGRTQTINEWARELGLSVKTLRSRIDRSKWSIKEALLTPAATPNKLYTYNGETHTIVEWAQLKGMSEATLRSRLNNEGWSFDKAITEPITQNEKYLEYNGEVHTQKEWGEITGLGTTFRSRIRQGWSIKDAVETPLLKKRTKPINAPVTYNGDTMPLKDLCAKYNKNYHTIQTRLQRGWTINEAMSTPASDGHHSRKKGNCMVKVTTV